MGEQAKVEMGDSGAKFEFQAPRSVLKASKAMQEAYWRQVRAAQEVADQIARESAEAERLDSRKGIENAEAVARSRKESPRVMESGALQVLARDGLMWLLRRGKIEAVHFDAGLKFRADYECANGTGVKSCLADQQPKGAPSFGPTDAMLLARGRVQEALGWMGTPLLHGYLVRVAGEGEMLNSPAFVSDERRVSDHFLPCRIAFDLLARGYGMIR